MATWDQQTALLQTKAALQAMLFHGAIFEYDDAKCQQFKNAKKKCQKANATQQNSKKPKCQKKCQIRKNNHLK